MAQQRPAPSSSPPTASPTENEPQPQEETPGRVVIDGQLVVTIYEPLAGHTLEERAEGIRQRIVGIAVSPEGVDSANLHPHTGWIAISIGGQLVMVVTDEDAAAAGVPLQQLATTNSLNIVKAIQDYRHHRSWKIILVAVGKTILATILFIAILWSLYQLGTRIRDRVEPLLHARAATESRSARKLAITYAAPVILAVGSVSQWLVMIALFEAYLSLVLGFFSATRAISLSVTRWVFSQVKSLAAAFVDYLPNFVVVGVIALVAYYVTRLLRLIFIEIKRGNLTIRGFYSDWAMPTYKLARALVIILALVVAFPYLPGAKTPAFQGISIFVGVLLSLGSSSAMANAISGILLTYMRSFLVGEWVQIGDTIGEVTERTLLVTRIRTPKDEIITIPNSTVMGGSVKNYSVEAKKGGVIFYTTATIGYDAPWRIVHQLMTDAALATKYVLREPAPFVLQRALNDFYVAYELNAYTDTPREMLNIFSELHQNIQDHFNEAGVEICSPHFAALRDANTIAIPEKYRGAEYKAPAFRVTDIGSGPHAGLRDPDESLAARPSDGSR